MSHLETCDEGEYESAQERTLDELDEGLPLVHRGDAEPPAFPRALSMDAVDEDTQQALAVFGEETPRVPTRFARDQIVWLATGFLTLILTGMAGAALVFFQRVANIVALLH